MYSELERKRATILADKEKLEETITKLDAERNKDIKKTVAEVSKSLGEIYSVLLAGTGARLNPIYDAAQNDAIVGLELRGDSNSEGKRKTKTAFKCYKFKFEI